MGLLVGLPLKLFHIVFVALRLAWPLLLILVLVLLWRRQRRGRQQAAPRQGRPEEPRFDGPVYTVDYEEVDSEDST